MSVNKLRGKFGAFLALIVAFAAIMLAGETPNASRLSSVGEEANAAQSYWTTRTVFAHYYPWYKNPTTSGAWKHWQDYGHNPPYDISSASYPALSAYDSTDAATLEYHMAWMEAAEVDVVLVSWWGLVSGVPSEENGNTQAILDAANTHGLKVAFMIDQYSGRNAWSAADDIAYINLTWGAHPAFYKAQRLTQYSPAPAQRGVFYIYQLDLNAEPQWTAAIDYIHNNPLINSIVLAQVLANSDELMNAAWVQDHVNRTHADGVFSYSTVNRFNAYTSDFPESNNWILVPGVSPGYDSTRNHGIGTLVDRLQGWFYDSSWWAIADKKPEWVSIISFNEWHETSQIEPAIPFSIPSFTYLDYEGHYGWTGVDGVAAYLYRTAYWANRYKGFISDIGDEDTDIFYNAWEEWLTTNPQRSCPVTTASNDEDVDSWPPDLNDDRSVNAIDMDILSGGMGYACGDQKFNVRLDLVNDCVIDDVDEYVINFYLGQTCAVGIPGG